VHEHLLSALGSIANPRVIDAGCGFGGTVFYLQARLGGRYDGLTLSRVQQARATREAARRALPDACRFHVRSYDGDLRNLVPEGADLVICIESLAHAPEPARSIANLAAMLKPGGRLAVVDDVPRDALADDDPDFQRFRAGWSCPAIARDRQLAAALAAARLQIEHDEDLTPLVSLREPGERDRLVRVNRRWRRVLGPTAVGAVVDSLYGGLMLERLYERGAVRYRLVLARPAA
jgi:cyclopropane fatty-acyl-phospholipid synthase-like methyltransferase